MISVRCDKWLINKRGADCSPFDFSYNSSDFPTSGSIGRLGKKRNFLMIYTIFN